MYLISNVMPRSTTPLEDIVVQSYTYVIIKNYITLTITL